MIRITDLTKRYGDVRVLDEFDMEIHNGAFTVLMGPSGCGKTTLAHILLGILKKDGGTVEGLESASLAAVFQEDRLCSQLSAAGNIRLILGDRAGRQEILEQLARVGLEEQDALRPVCQLSGGQKRRAAIVRAVMAGAGFTCLDEPFKGLDSDTKAKVMEYVKEALEGKTVLLVTHDKSEANFFGGNVIELDQSMSVEK